VLNFRLFGIPVSIRLGFVLLGAVLGWSGGYKGIELGIWLGIVFVSVLAHEMGHAIAVRAFGLAPQIELHGMGGTTSWQPDARVTPGRRIVVSLAGPGAGFVLGAIVLVAFVALRPAEGTVAGNAVSMALWVNVGWGALNLLPMLPLDGGNVMASVLEILAPNRGLRLARYVSIGLCVAAGALAAWANQIWPLVLAGYFAFQNFIGLRAHTVIERDRDLHAELDRAQAALAHGDALGAERGAQDVLAVAKSDGVRAEAAQVVAFARLTRGDADGAAAALASMPPGLAPAPVIEGMLALARGRHDEALGILERAYADQPNELVADAMVRAELAAGRLDGALARVSADESHELGRLAWFRVHEALHHAARYEDAVTLGDRMFAQWKSPLDAFNNACALSRAGRPLEALSWLERARDAGLHDGARLVDSDGDLAAVRELPEFQAFRASMA